MACGHKMPINGSVSPSDTLSLACQKYLRKNYFPSQQRSVLLHANIYVENTHAFIKCFYFILRRVRSAFAREEHEGAKLLVGKEGCPLWKKNGADLRAITEPLTSFLHLWAWNDAQIVYINWLRFRFPKVNSKGILFLQDLPQKKGLWGKISLGNLDSRKIDNVLNQI